MRKGKRLPLEDLAPCLLELPADPVLLDLPALFGSSNPVELEVGFGKGTFLVAAAQANPDINYLGLEIDRGLELYVANRIMNRNLTNVRLIKGDARFVLRDYLPQESLQAIHVYFPDPWWKKRHKKRRVFTSEFAAQCERVLCVGGRLFLATDVEEYFGVMTQLLKQNTNLQPGDLCTGLSEPQTNFERKALERSLPVWRAAYRKAVGR